MFEELSPPYSTIVVDPPWPYDAGWPQWGDHAGIDHVRNPLPYSAMTIPEIAEMPVLDLAGPNAHLYLWTTNQHIWAARDIAYGWGFDVAQILTWCKPPRLGPGGLFATTTEFVLYGRRSIKAKRQVERAGALIHDAREAAGITRAELHRLVRGGTPTGIVFRWEDDDSLPNEQDWERLVEALPSLQGVERPFVEPPPPREQTRVNTSWWEWPRGPHSTKPAGFMDIVEVVSPSPYVELFARQPRLGWDAWGYGYEAREAS